MSRRASEGASSVLSFTFLDVLMCTMGSLLLLLVVFGVIAKKGTRMRREGEDAHISITALSAPSAPPSSGNTAEDAPPASKDDPAKLALALEQVRSEQARLEQLRTEAAQRRREEQDRIAHLEEHERRLEHELAELHVTLEALESAEKKENVDQAQADAEAKRLKELIKETEERLAEMRKKGAGDKSYAIVPYKGKNGTFRRPVFVECTADAVTIQPEGIRLLAEDFDGPLRSGNPLAAAIRAAHEELNARAVAAGKTDMPDPYPLLIVRPDGSAAYAAAVDAIRSWDSDYGYEFVEADWKLKYPEPDPRLAQLMAHAVDEARQRQALLAKVAPRRYASRLSGAGGGAGNGAAGTGGGSGVGGGTGTGNGGTGAGGFNALAYGGPGGAGGGMGPHAAGGSLGGDSKNPLRGSSGRGGAGGNFSDEFAPPSNLAVGGAGTGGQGGGGGGGGAGGGAGAAGGGVAATGNGAVSGPGGSNAQGASDGSRHAAGTAAAAGSTTASGQGGRYGEQAANGTSGAGAGGDGQSGVAGANGMASSNAGGASGAQGATGGATGGAGGAGASGAVGGSSGMGSGSSAATSGPSSSLAAGGSTGSPADPSNPGMPTASYTKTIGSHSAAESRGVNWANAEASRRTSAVTRPIKVVVSTQQLAVLDDGAAPTIVTFQQPADRVLDQLAESVQEHIRDWGLAGANMYWRPTLVVTVAPGAQRQAERLGELLENSGVDVRLPQATASAAQGTGNVTR